MNRILLLALCFLVSLDAARSEPPRLAAGQRLEGRFVQERQLKGFNNTLRSEGRFVLAPGKGLLWKGEKPFAVTTIITASGIVQMIDGAEASRLSAARAPFLSRFYDMLGGALLGDLGALERDFAVKREGGSDKWRLTLTPRAEASAIAQQIESIVVTGASFAEQVEIAKPGGDHERLVFSEQRLAATPLTAEDERLFAAAAK